MLPSLPVTVKQIGSFYVGEIYYKIYHSGLLLTETQSFTWEYAIDKHAGGSGLGYLHNGYFKRHNAAIGKFSIDKNQLSADDGGDVFLRLLAGAGIMVSERIEPNASTHTTQHTLISMLEMRENVTGARIEDYSINHATNTITIFSPRTVAITLRYLSDDDDLLGWNLLNNGGFEGELSWLWEKHGSSSIARISAIESVYTDLFGLAVTPVAQNDGVKYSDPIPVSNNQVYRFSFWCKGTADDTIRVQWTDGSGQTVMTPVSDAGTISGSWKLHEFTFAPDEIEITDIRIENTTASPSAFYLDEVMLRLNIPVVDVMKAGNALGFLFDVVGYNSNDDTPIIRIKRCEVYDMSKQSGNSYSEKINGQFLSAEMLDQLVTDFPGPLPPAPGEVAYFGSKENGVYYTPQWRYTGDQPVWGTINDGLPSLKLTQFFIDPNAPEYQLVLLNIGNDTAHGYGRVFRRANGGSWSEAITIAQIRTLLNPTAQDIIIGGIFNNLLNGKIYISIKISAWSGLPRGGWIIPSSDYGATWDTPIQFYSGFYGGCRNGVGYGDVIYITGGRGSYSDIRVQTTPGGAWVDVGLGSSEWWPRIAMKPGIAKIVYVSGNGTNGPDLVRFEDYLASNTILQDAFDIAPALVDSHWIKSTDYETQRILKNYYIRKTTNEWDTFTQYAQNPELYDFMWVNDPAGVYVILGKRQTLALPSPKHVIVMTTDEGVTTLGRAGDDPTTGVDSIQYNLCGGICNGGFAVVQS